MTVSAARPIEVELAADLTTIGGDYLVASADGSVIAFNEIADGLVPGDTNETWDVFVLDRASDSLIRASESSSGDQADGESFAPVLTADGSQVLFSSTATNLVADDENDRADIFIRDLASGSIDAITLVRDTDTDGLDLALAAASADASRLLVVGDAYDHGGTSEGTFLIDRVAGTTTQLSDVGSRFSTFGDLADLSADGTHALVPTASAGVELVDLDTGTRTALAVGASVQDASLSADGRFVAFVTSADGVVAGDVDGQSDLFLYDHDLGQTWRVSVDEDGDPIRSPLAADFSQRFFSPVVETAPGGSVPRVAFGSDLGLTPDDTNETSDVYLLDVDAIAVADDVVTAPGTPVRIDVLANDIDLDGGAPTLASVESTPDGTTAIDGNVVLFTPAADAGEIATFRYTLADGEGNVDQAVVRVRMAAPGPLVVTTTEDVEAEDGLLSLREAVAIANGRSGEDRIEFADALRGSTVRLVDESLAVTDDLVIDGDTADGGAAAITVLASSTDPGGLASALRTGEASLRIEDLGLAAVPPYGAQGVYSAIYARGGALQLSRVDISGFGAGGGGTGVAISGGSLDVTRSRISDIGGYYAAFGIAASDSIVTVTNSTIANLGAEFAAGIEVTGADSILELSGAHITDIGGDDARGVSSDGTSSIQGSTISDISASGGGSVGVWALGTLTMSNSSVGGGYSNYGGAGIQVETGASATITNVTVAGNISGSGEFAGVVVADGGTLVLQNSLVAGNEIADPFGGSSEPPVASDVRGSFLSNGHNVFGQGSVVGALPEDATGVDAADLFAVLGTAGRPVLTDNGGLTPTFALLDSETNPALDGAEPTVAPAVDQRGAARVGAPDVGSVEADGFTLDLTGLPELVDRQPVDPNLVNGVDPALLRGDGTSGFNVTFLAETAAYDSVLGYYVVEGDDDFGEVGSISEVGLLFPSTSSAVPGAAIQLDPLQPGQSLGLFLVADGADLNRDLFRGDPDLFFYDRSGNGASVFDRVPELNFSTESDFGRVRGAVYHASDFAPDDPGNPLNPGGLVRTLSGLDPDGNLLIAWEDQARAADSDYNDLIVRVERVAPLDVLI